MTGSQGAEGVVNGKIDAIGHVLFGQAHAVHHAGQRGVDQYEARRHTEYGQEQGERARREQARDRGEEEQDAATDRAHLTVQQPHDLFGKDPQQGADEGRDIEQACSPAAGIRQEFPHTEGRQVQDRGMREDAQGADEHEQQQARLAQHS